MTATPTTRCKTCGQIVPHGGLCSFCNASLSDLVGKHTASKLGEPVELPTTPAPGGPYFEGANPQAKPEIATDIPSLVTPEERHSLRERRAQRRAARMEPTAEEARVASRPLTKAVPTEIVTLTSLKRGQRLDPGVQAAPFSWLDLLDGDRPPRRGAGEGAYAVYHNLEVDEDVRIGYYTVIGSRVTPPDPSVAGDLGKMVIRADSRIHVQKRALLEVMDDVRARADRYADRARRRHAQRLARHRWAVLGWPRGTRRLGFGLVKVESRLDFLGNVIPGLMRAAVELPDVVASNALRVDAHLNNRLGRRNLWEGIKDPTELSPEQRIVVLFLTLFAIGFAILFGSFAVTVLAPSLAPIYTALLFNAGIQLVGMNPVFAPPIELLFLQSLEPNGATLTFVSFMLGKILGAWILFLLGDTLRDIVMHHVQTPRMRRLFDWLTRNANKYGFPILLLDNAIPGMPDQVLFIFAFTGVNFRPWMWGIAVGTAIKFGAIIVLTEVLHLSLPF